MEWICFEGSVYALYCREGQRSGSVLRVVSILQRQWSGSVLRVVSMLYTAGRASGVDLF